MDTGRYTKLRTTIIVVSMLVLPAAAVLGLKRPVSSTPAKADQEQAARTKASSDRTARGGANQGPAPAANKERGTGSARAPHAATTASGDVPQGAVVQAGGVAGSPGALFPTQLAANIDVAGPPPPVFPASTISTAAPLQTAATLQDLGAPAEPSASTAPLSFTLPQTTAPAVSSPPAAPAGTEQFSLIQSRLRALGATHYALETWGNAGQLYRFQCRMAAGHSAGYTRQFEATDTDALAAMKTVLEEVEAWKAGRLP